MPMREMPARAQPRPAEETAELPDAKGMRLPLPAVLFLFAALTAAALFIGCYRSDGPPARDCFNR